MLVRSLSRKYKLEELRSKDFQHPCYIRFINNTERNLFLLWLDHEGKLHLYSVIPSESYFDVNTYVSHPWVFLDCRTLDHLVVNFEEVYFVESCPASTNWPGRKAVFITNPLHTLKKLALLAVRDNLPLTSDVAVLELPQGLQQELSEELEKYRQIKANLGISL